MVGTGRLTFFPILIFIFYFRLQQPSSCLLSSHTLANLSCMSSNKRRRETAPLELNSESFEANCESTCSKNKKSSSGINNTTFSGASQSISHSFPVNIDDHAETSVEAYTDIIPVLQTIAKSLQKKNHSLSIYDPYYCK